MPVFPVKRKDFAPGKIACDYCWAHCCRYFSVHIPEPETRRDYDTLLWYMEQGNITYYTDAGTWYMLVNDPCEHILPNNLCGTYPTRPEICRAYSSRSCEYDNDFVYQRLFETTPQLREYAESVFEAVSSTKKPPRSASWAPGPFFSIKVDTPSSRAEFDTVRWFLYHKSAAAYVVEGEWYIRVYPDRGGPDPKTGRRPNRDYDSIPQVSETYAPLSHYAADFAPDLWFETGAQIEEYADVLLPPRREPKKSATSPLLPVLPS